MTNKEINKLRIGDKVEFQTMNGRFIYTGIITKRYTDSFVLDKFLHCLHKNIICKIKKI